MLKVDTNGRTEDGKLRTITLLGVDPANRIGEPKMREGKASLIYERDSAVIDPGGWDIMFPGEKFVPGRRLRVHDQWLTMQGLSDASPPFTGFPVIHTSFSTARALNRAEQRTNTFLVGRTKPGIVPEDVAQVIAAQTPWRAYSRAGFEHQSFTFYESQGVPMIFYVTITIGLVVGTAFTAQTFIMFIKENARGLTTLKVMGVTHGQLAVMMAAQAVLITLLGLSFGTLAAALVSEATRQVPFLRGLYIPIPVVIRCSLFMAAIAFISATIGFRRVLRLQPADVFRS